MAKMGDLQPGQGVTWASMGQVWPDGQDNEEQNDTLGVSRNSKGEAAICGELMFSAI
jgi:hypothetical protein